MALHGQPGEQLTMFMKASELYSDSSIIHGDLNARAGQRPESMWGIKRQHAVKSAMGQDVASQGVQEPVQLRHDPEYGGKAKLVDGHHRVVTAFDHDPESYVPVVHHDTQQQQSGYMIGRNGKTPTFRNH